jgi:hypothetical protein
MIQIFNRMESTDYDAPRFRAGQVPRNGIIGKWLSLTCTMGRKKPHSAISSLNLSSSVVLQFYLCQL